MGGFVDDVLGFDDSGGLGSLYGQVTGYAALEDGFKSISGQDAADAARESANNQAAAGQSAIDVGNAAQLRLEEQLAPYAQFGESMLGRAGTLFGADPYTAAANDPGLQALQEQSMQAILANQAARGRVNSGGTDKILQNNYLANSQNYVNNERNSIMQALGLGQNSAAQTGASITNNAANTGNLLTQIENSQAAGSMAGQQARAAGIGNLISLGATAFGGGI